MKRFSRLNRIVIVAGATVTIAALGTATALATWSSHGAATATVKADAVPTAPAPDAVADGTSVTITMPDDSAGSGPKANGYRVLRFGAEKERPGRIEATNGCSGVVRARACVEKDVPPGTWRYAVRFVAGGSWAGPDGKLSTHIKVDKPKDAPGAELAAAQSSGGTATPTPPSTTESTSKPTVESQSTGPATSTTTAPPPPPVTQPADPPAQGPIAAPPTPADPPGDAPSG